MVFCFKVISICLNISMVNRLISDKLNKEFDLVIIGGGINGCGIARDASERGLKVLLLEKEDFGSGCTSASTRLIHGGLRYLEHFEFDLVRESLLERERLLKNASHLIKPIELLIPVYKTDKRNYWLVKLGMTLYDLLSFDKTLPSHKMLSRKSFLEYESSVKKQNFSGGAIFYDCQATYPERICIENIIMAKQNGALVLNHAEVTKINTDTNKISSVEFLDKLSNVKYKVSGKIVVNVSGPWVDTLCGLVNKGIKRQIGGTKGSHIVISQFEDGPKHALYVSAKSDARPFFIIPWQNYYLIGTTDIPFQGNIDRLKIGEEEINYLLSEANNVLSSKQISRSDVLFSYCGVRPLPFTGETDPSKITRRHIIHDHGGDGINNLFSVIGGKLTTYRALSEELVDLVYKKLNYKFIKCLTHIKPLIGNVEGDIEKYKKQEIGKVKKKYDLEPEIILHLIDLYGKKYKTVFELALREQDLGYLLSSSSLDIRAQVVHAIQNEMACTVSDVLLRRTSLGLSEGLGQDSISEVVKQLKLFLNLSQEEVKKQTSDYEENVVKVRRV